MKTPVLFAATLLALPALAQAQKIAPGLWEYTMTMQAQGGRAEAANARMQEQMAKMTPEQRKMMESMMAQRGVAMASGGPPGAMPGTTVRVCITPEQAARNEMPHQDGNCRQTGQERSGNTLKFRIACTGEHPSSGEGQFTLNSDKSVSGQVTMQPEDKSLAERVQMQHQGRWIAADCGDVKPRAK